MEEEQRLRGRLSRRRPPAGGGAPNCPPWFLLEDRKREPWAALLRSTVSGNVDLTRKVEPLPPLPALPGQESLPDPEPTVPPEVFTVGSKTFSWTPFPPAFGDSGNSYELFHGAGGSLGSLTPSLKGYPAPDSRQTPSTEECVSVQSPPVLLNCPLCQKAFDPKLRLLKTGPLKGEALPTRRLSSGCPKLTQLDVDSHLAQCLAESTEDVMWHRA